MLNERILIGWTLLRDIAGMSRKRSGEYGTLEGKLVLENIDK
jgi:hypothetical protein